MLHKTPNITFPAIFLSLVLIVIPVASLGQDHVRYGTDIKKEAPVRYGLEIEKRPRVRYGVDISVEDIRQVRPGEIVPEEVPSDFEFTMRNYLKFSGYYEDYKEHSLINPLNILGLEETGLNMEFNTQFKISYLNDYQFIADVGYLATVGTGDQGDDDTHYITNEFFFDFFVAELFYFKVGKKRETWGVGYTFNPVQIIDFPKNLIDPYENREGNYLATFEIPVGNATMSFIYFPYVEFNLETDQGQSGIPNHVKYSDDREDFAARLSLLLWDTDISFIYYYADVIETVKKSYFGVSLNRYWGDLGVYFEAAGQEGKDQEYLVEDIYILDGVPTLVYYWPTDDELVEIKEAEDNIYVNFAIGANYTFPDSTKISLEYFRNSEGYSSGEFDYFYNAVTEAGESYIETQDYRIENKILKTNQVLADRIRQNYLSVTFDRPNTFDDFFPHLNAVICLDDGSFMLNGTIDYAVRDDTTISLDLIGYAGESDSEFGLKPDDYKATLRLEYYF
ncbi:MAG: hypothetical protein PVJ20_09035 [Desulfobacterales bacterium]|jgi:hypothetical protein